MELLYHLHMCIFPILLLLLWKHSNIVVNNITGCFLLIILITDMMDLTIRVASLADVYAITELCMHVSNTRDTEVRYFITLGKCNEENHYENHYA